ncbi:MAG: hypothetical protein NZL89_01425 [Leptospiraceae bacterium]|nr:hypothetical protein [Leptospiraceae bacterium]
MPYQRVQVDPKVPEAVLHIADKAIRNEHRLRIRTYGFIPATEYFVRDVIKKILTQYHRPELSSPIAMITKELAVNAAKANFKRIIFHEHGVNLNDPNDYERGMRIFRAAISDRMSHEYGRKAKEAELHIQALFDFNPDRIIIKIRNNLGMTRQEESRVRDKLREAMQCTDVADFLADHVDETEGAGLGLALSIAMLKSTGIDPHLLTVKTDNESYTVARLEIPLNPNYVPFRHRYAQRLLARQQAAARDSG